MKGSSTGPALSPPSARTCGLRLPVRLQQRDRRAAPLRTTLHRSSNSSIWILRLRIAPPQPLHPAPQLCKSSSHGVSSPSVYTPVNLKL